MWPSHHYPQLPNGQPLPPPYPPYPPPMLGIHAQPAPPPFPPMAPPAMHYHHPPPQQQHHHHHPGGYAHMQPHAPPGAMAWAQPAAMQTSMWPPQPAPPAHMMQQQQQQPHNGRAPGCWPQRAPGACAGGRAGGGGGRAGAGRGNGRGCGGPGGAGPPRYGLAGADGTDGGAAQPRRPTAERGGAPATGEGSVELRCEPCDKAFSSVKDQLAHLASHVRCPHCAFEGTRRVTNIHQQNAHGTGPGARLGLGQAASAGAVEAAEGALRSEEEEAYLRSCAAAAGALPESAEETAAYLAARKRAFPTAQHVQRKADELKAAIERGELPAEQTHGKRRAPRSAAADGASAKRSARPRMRCTYFGTARGCRHGDRCKFLHELPSPSEQPAGAAATSGTDAARAADARPAAASCAPGAPAAGAVNGLAGLLAAYDGASDDDELNHHNSPAAVPPLAVARAPSLDLDSVPDETDDQPDARPPATRGAGAQVTAAAPAGVLGGDSAAPRAAQRPLEKAAGDSSAGVNAGRRGGAGDTRKAQPPAAPRAPALRAAPSLLQKLLSKEVRAEKSLILQAIRHIVSASFLHIADRK